MKINNLKGSRIYHYINKCLLIFVLCVFGYVVVINTFNVEIGCQHNYFFAGECPSCGLTRGVYEGLRLNFNDAIALNKNSLLILTCLFTQLIFRLLVYFKFESIIRFAAPIAAIDILIVLTPLIAFKHG